MDGRLAVLSLCREPGSREAACSSSCRSRLHDSLESGSAGNTGGKGLGVDGKCVWSCFYFMILSIFDLAFLCHLRGAAKCRRVKEKSNYYFSKAAVTKHLKQGGLEQNKFIIL